MDSDGRPGMGAHGRLGEGLTRSGRLPPEYTEQRVKLVVDRLAMV